MCKLLRQHWLGIAGKHSNSLAAIRHLSINRESEYASAVLSLATDISLSFRPFDLIFG
jgi:hypothetical protein